MEEPKICPVNSFYQRILLPASYSLVFLLGLALNGALLWCLRFRARRACSTVIYMTNLAVADLFYVLALPPLIISNAMGDMWPFGNIICKTVRFFFLGNLHCSVMFLTCVSVHRFLGVCHPIVSVRLRTKKLALYTSGSVWILANAEVIPTLVFTHTGVINNMTVCFEMTNPGGFKAYFPYGLFLSLAFLIQFLVTVTCYCAMIRTLGVANCIANVRAARMRKRSLHTLLVVSLVFVVCFVPYHIARTVYLFVRVYRPLNCSLLNVAMICYKVWKPVVSFNCCANPLLYFCGSGRHRQRLRAWLWRRKRRVHPSVCPVDVDSTKRSAD